MSSTSSHSLVNTLRYWYTKPLINRYFCRQKDYLRCFHWGVDHGKNFIAGWSRWSARLGEMEAADFFGFWLGAQAGHFGICHFENTPRAHAIRIDFVAESFGTDWRQIPWSSAADWKHSAPLAILIDLQIAGTIKSQERSWNSFIFLGADNAKSTCEV